MLMAVDKIRSSAEHFCERRKLNHHFSMDNFRVQPTEQAGAQQFWKRRKHTAIDRLEMHRERPKRGRQSDVQAEGATPTASACGLQCADFGAADRRTKNHY